MSTTTRIHIVVNGQDETVASETMLPAVLEAFGVDPVQGKGIAVAVNESIVPRKLWHTTGLQEGDAVEIITASQGG